MLQSNINLYVVLRVRDGAGVVLRLFPVVAWDNRGDFMVAVIPTSLADDDFKKAYPVDAPEVVVEYGYILEYVTEDNLSSAIQKWHDWTDGDEKVFFVFGRDF